MGYAAIWRGGEMQRRIARYGWALVFVAATYLLRILLDPFIGDRTPFVVLFLLPVIAAAWRFGMGPAMAAAVLGLLVGDRVSLDPENGVPLAARAVRIACFLLESWFVAWVLRSREQESVARRESERRYRHLAENFPGGAVLMVDRELRYTMADGHGLADAGVTRDQMIGRTPREVYPAAQAEHIIARYQAALRGEPTLEEHVLNGRAHLVRTVPMRDELGEVQGAITVTQDVSEQRKLEQQLRETQKLEAVGRLAGGVAHDFNNLLAIISGSCELIMLQPDKPRALTEQVLAIDEAAQRAAGLTRQLLAFSRQQVLETELVELRELLQELTPSLLQMAGDRARLVVQPGGEGCKVRINRTQAERAICNLVVNARDAMPDGGVVTVSTRCQQVGAESQDQLHVPVGSYAVLSVRDSGVGMDQHTREHLFEPYFTTKGDKGTGLGLTIVHGFVGHSQGHVRVVSEPGQGTEIQLFLPLVEQQVVRRVSGRVPAQAAGRHVLVVDDEDSIRDLITQLLVSHGYSVHGTRDAESALALVTDDVSLVIVDMELPGMSGRELCRALRRARPRLPLLLVSGAARDLPEQELAEAPWAFLAKPFGMTVLADHVAALCEPRSAPEREEQLRPAS